MSTNTIDDLVKGVILHGPNILERCTTTDNISKYVERVVEERLDYPIPKNKIDPTNWLIPNQYKSFDVEKYCLDLCENDEQKSRVVQEIRLYNSNNFIPVLQAIKYVVDTLRENNIVWGVGRGSSVASYVLFLLGVHKIDSIKYNIPIEEFFKEIQYDS